MDDQVKHHPAVVISITEFNRRHDHLTLAMISSAKNSTWESDVTIRNWKTAALLDFCTTGFIFPLPVVLIHRKLGRLSAHDRASFLKAANNTLCLDR
jgi:mRNA interferase MazF